ncbi:MAG: YtxH domain-containing protein [Abditibacteriaceae bacterium]
MGRNSEEYHPEKVVVITGPTLGSSLKLILFGALLGAAGTLFCLRQQDEDDSIDIDRKDKARQLLRRTGDLARRTKDLAQTVAQDVLPQWQEAVETVKSTAAETEHELHREIEDDD